MDLRGKYERGPAHKPWSGERGHTEIDPNATWGKDAVDDAKVVDNVLGVEADWDRVIHSRQGLCSWHR